MGSGDVRVAGPCWSCGQDGVISKGSGNIVSGRKERCGRCCLLVNLCTRPLLNQFRPVFAVSAKENSLHIIIA